MSKILIAGGSGFVGHSLTEKLLTKGHEVIILTRRLPKSEAAKAQVNFIEWHPENDNEIVREVDGMDAIINLAGEPVVKRWSLKQKTKSIN